jgi:hypothetical protein
MGGTMRKWIIGTLLAALAAAVAGVATDLATSAEHQAGKAISDLTGLGHSGRGVLKTASGPTIALQIDQGMGCGGTGWVFPFPPHKIANAPPGTGPRRRGGTWDKAPAAFGAVPADPVTLLIRATATLHHAITLTDLKVHVVSRKPAIQGTRLNVTGGCGAAGTFRYGYINLDLSPPYWVPHAHIPKAIRADALKFPYTVTANDPEILLITVTTKHCACRWYAELDWIDGSTSGQTKITDHGHNFATTAHAKMPGFVWSPVSGAGNTLKYRRARDTF